MNLRFYHCDICGKVITILSDTGIPTNCCGQVMQELVKAVFYLRSTLYVSMPEKANRVDVHNSIPPDNTIYIVTLNMYIVKR